jgi:signal transduction histidine kinase/CheY-like chemotaxis protein/HPt (histidine-containing phosphotransfer) domain-containing protein
LGFIAHNGYSPKNNEELYVSENQAQKSGGWPLRWVLMSALLSFCIVPAVIVGSVLYKNSIETVDVLSEKIIGDVAERVSLDTVQHLQQAHIVLNGLIETDPGEAGVKRAAQMMTTPEAFEATAFALTRMTPEVPYLYTGTARGEFWGVEIVSRDASGLMRVNIRREGDEGRRYYSAQFPGDRSQALPTETRNYEPRTRPWYQAAVDARSRVFSPVYPSASKKQLLITLAQPVYDKDGAAMGVFAADLFLKQLSETMRSMRISARGLAFLVDETGQLVASSTGDDLYEENNGKLSRLKPDASRSPYLRAAYERVKPDIGRKLQDSVQRASYIRRFGQGNDAMIVNLRPFGDSLGLRWSLVVAAPESDFAGSAQQALGESMLILLGLVALAAALAGALAWRLSRRFKLLSQAAAQLGLGQIPAAQSTARVAEVRALSATLHDSAEEIARNRTALQEANEHLEERVALRTQELAASREEALAAAKAKAAFLATMSHEIRTPLNGVVGMTTLLADTKLDVEQKDYLHTMRVSSDQLLSVINDILDYSKIESGKLDLESEPLSVQGTIEEACDIAAARAREKGLELLVDVGDEVPPWVRGDVTRLRQVLLNFINNAIKFTEQGQVLVSAHLKEDFDMQRVVQGQQVTGALIEFRVKDSGIGIPKERQGALFQSFTQVDASTTRKYGGTGLGLAISKRLAEFMGGTVGLESEPGQGSTFWFTARMDYSDAPEHSDSSLLQMTTLEGCLAVVVDDMPVNIQILEKQLKRWKMNTVAFNNAPDALKWLATREADVVLTDMHMPEMDGIMFARELHKIKPHAKLVLLTSGTMPAEQDMAQFSARLLKPYRQSQLFGALARILYTGAAPETVQQPKRGVQATGQTILVADDNLVNLKVAVSMLSKLGYESVTVMDGQQAADSVLASLQPGGKRFAAVLMDANMPVMDGFASSRQIIATHGKAAPPIIALTASVLEEDRQRCLDAGMIGFLPKPLRLDELSGSLQQYARLEDASDSSFATNSVAKNVDSFPTNGTISSQNVPQAALMDWSRLEQFKEFDDEERSMTREVIGLFVQDAPSRRDDILASLNTTDAALLSRRAHALKGAASNVGAVALTEACSVLEQECKKGVWPDNVREQIEQIDHLTNQTLLALKDWKL